jgi:hypothetical protein
MTPEETIKALEDYRDDLTGIMERFVHRRNSYDIQREDDPRYRTIVIEVIDVINDIIGDNKYSQLVYQLFHEGISNFMQTPSYKSIEDIVSVIDSVITWLKRNTDKLNHKNESITEISQDQKSKEQEIPEIKRTIERTDLTITDLLFSSNYKLKILVVAVFLSGFGIGIGLGASKLYKEKIAPLIDLYKTQDIQKK